MVRMVRMVRSLGDRTFQLWYAGRERPGLGTELRFERASPQQKKHKAALMVAVWRAWKEMSQPMKAKSALWVSQESCSFRSNYWFFVSM